MTIGQRHCKCCWLLPILLLSLAASSQAAELRGTRELGPSDDATCPFKTLPPIFRDLPGSNSSVPIPPFDMDATPPASLSDAPPPRHSGSGGSSPILGDLSIPQDDPDYKARKARLSWRAGTVVRYWQPIPYTSQANNEFFPFATSGGITGNATRQQEEIGFEAKSLRNSFVAFFNFIAPMNATCYAISPTGDCFTALDSFKKLYSVVGPDFKPKAADFYLSDESFARERLTSSPVFLTRLSADLLSQRWPTLKQDIVGLEEILQGHGGDFDRLLSQGKLFYVDWSAEYEAGALKSAPLSVLEVPTAFFFLGRDKVLRPLAIKFRLTNQNVYSPKDPLPDWYLAKSVFSSLDTQIKAEVHFILHFVLANLRIAVERTLASEHPLYGFIVKASELSIGIVPRAYANLWAPLTGYDQQLMIEGNTTWFKLIPFYIKRWTWRDSFLKRDLEKRGVSSLPNYLYRDDAKANYDALFSFFRIYLTSFYAEDGSIQGDEELQALLSYLSSGQLGSLPGFPQPSEVTSVNDLSTIMAQIVWLSAVQHQNLNGNSVVDFDLVFPLHVGKIWKTPPATKGVLTEGQLVSQYLTGGIPTFTTKITQFINNMYLASTFRLLLQKPDRLPNYYFSQTDDVVAAGLFTGLRLELQALSSRIQEREKATSDRLPRYSLLDPQEMPYYSFI